ncbi:MAG: DUF362 domain-containing protein [Candidatus Methanomethyliaceae archaeon]
MKSASEWLENLKVAIYHDPELEYPSETPYSPHTKYPEYPFQHISKTVNGVYDAVRQIIMKLGLDSGNFETSHWNPLKGFIQPGNTVVIKPNFVLERHDRGGDLFAIITHPSVLRAVIDFVYLALQGQGRIIIADAPQMDCNFNRLVTVTNLKSIQEFYKREAGFNLEIYDLRNFWFNVDEAGSAGVAYSKYRYPLPGDPQGEVVVSLGKNSLFYGLDSRNFYGADYDRREVIRFHHGEIHDYVLSKTILSADVVILVPKLKTHKKVGVTLNIKGLVGMVTNKNCLVHYRLGTPSVGGDQFPDDLLDAKEKARVKLQRMVYDLFLSHRHPVTDAIYDIARKTGSILLNSFGFKVSSRKALLDAGNWFGNDSAWRMAVDLYRIFLYADQKGSLSTVPVRKIFSIIDGIVGGEEEGPLVPRAKRCGVLIAGFNPGVVDIVATRVMGFDYRRVRMLSSLLLNPESFHISLDGISVLSNNDEYTNLLESTNKKKYLNFEPSPGWKEFIEI